MSGKTKDLAFVHRNDTRFAVGDFYPVLSVFSYHELGNTVSPFLLLDHLGPGKILPSTKRRGVDKHPHRGFETVTIVYQGELEHKDSTGNCGLIRTDDVQWMTAAGGVIHQELFSEAFTQTGGAFEMVQLWVNLPAADKLKPAQYQSLDNAAIPRVQLADNHGVVRVIAGEYAGVVGPASTHTRINMLDVRLEQLAEITIQVPSGDTTLVYLCSGRVQVNNEAEIIESQSLAVLSALGDHFTLKALERCKLLVLTGEPINEPINGHGPFVMNNYDEILQAYDDIKNNNFIKTAP